MNNSFEKLVVTLYGRPIPAETSLADIGRMKLFYVMLIAMGIGVPASAVASYVKGQYILTAAELLTVSACYLSFIMLRVGVGFSKVSTVYVILLIPFFNVLTITGGADGVSGFLWQNIFTISSYFIFGISRGCLFNVAYGAVYIVIIASQVMGLFSTAYSAETLGWGLFQFVVGNIAVYFYELTRANYEVRQIKRAEDLHDMTLKDPLTGIYNRRYFDEIFPKEITRCQRIGEPLTIAVCDIDNFKNYNDNYGHGQGDEVLKRVAGELLNICKRSSDVAARIGGEEFVLILPGMPREAAGKALEEICNNVAMREIPHEYSDVSDFVTVSIGFCSIMPDSGTTPRNLFDKADEAMYRAKELGRNRVVSAN